MNKIGGKNFNNGKYGDVNQQLYCPDCKHIGTFTEWLDQPGGYLEGVICDNCGSNRQQKEPAYYDLHAYKEKCKCGQEITFLTQDDRNPEYYTDVGILCSKCQEPVFISLPVN